MQQALILLFCSRLPLAILSCLIPLTAKAQITPDRTTSTTVNQNGNDFTINQGDRAGSNLFHSFGEFSIPTDGSAFFDNAADIVNIFSRVTGGNLSHIDGLLRANGSANLFLLNPAGIIFGSNARLDIGGSFLGTTADSFLFEDGEFSATDLDNPPLLTINAPIGLSFRDNPGEIVNRSVAQNSTGDIVGLEVAPEKNLTLVGGNINFDAGNTTTSGGNLELGGLSAAGTVTFNDNGHLDFPEDVAKADITLSNGATIDVRGTGGGNITINARNLNLETENLSLEREDFRRSQIRAGIVENSTVTDAQAGKIIINATDNVTVDGSFIKNEVALQEKGNGEELTAGNLTIKANSVKITDDSEISTRTFGTGNAGSITIDLANSGTFNLSNKSNISTSAFNDNTFGEGKAGDLAISANSVKITDNSQIVTNVIGGKGDAGNITIDVTNGGGGTFNLSKNSTVAADTSGKGNAGDLGINAVSVNIIDSSEITTRTFSEGNAGDLGINASSVELTDSSITTESSGGGNAGSITIDLTEDLRLRDNSFISARALEDADGGNLNINARFILAFPSKGNGNDIIATAERGNGGNITINASQLFNLQKGRAIDSNGNFIPNNRNDIDASSQAEGLDGTISISNPEINPIQTEIELPKNIVESETLGANACSGGGTEASSFIVKGKGGIPPQPTEPFDSDTILVDEQNTTPNLQTQTRASLGQQSPHSRASLAHNGGEGSDLRVTRQYPDIKPIKTSMGDIYPARGIIKTEDGKIILTKYPTDNINTRIPHNSANCTPL